MKLRSHDAETENQIIYIQSIESFKCCEEEIGKRLHKMLFTLPWQLNIQWSMLNEKTVLDRKDVIYLLFLI